MLHIGIEYLALCGCPNICMASWFTGALEHMGVHVAQSRKDGCDHVYVQLLFTVELSNYSESLIVYQ